MLISVAVRLCRDPLKDQASPRKIGGVAIRYGNSRIKDDSACVDIRLGQGDLGGQAINLGGLRDDDGAVIRQEPIDKDVIGGVRRVILIVTNHDHAVGKFNK